MVEQEELDQAQQEARSRPYSVAPGPNISSIATAEEEEAPRQRPLPAKGRVLPDLTNGSDAPPTPSPIILENNRTIEIERFVPRDQIDPRYHDTPYYVAPREQVGLEAFAVIRDAMRGKEMVGMGRVILSKRERPIIVEPLGNGLRAMTLRYVHEVRSETEYFSDIQDVRLPPEMLRVAEHILEVKSADFDPGFLEDRYRSVLVEMLRGKQAELPAMRAGTPSRENVINLMDALKRSLATEAPPSQTGTRKPVARRAAQPPKSGKRSRRA